MFFDKRQLPDQHPYQSNRVSYDPSKAPITSVRKSLKDINDDKRKSWFHEKEQF